MKRTFVSLMIFIILISLCSCGKSAAAIDVDNLISAIGEVTLDSERDINKAEEAVANLKENDYKQLEQVPMLEAARSAYDELVKENEEEISDVQKVVDPSKSMSFLEMSQSAPKELKDYEDYPGILDFGVYSGLKPNDKKQVNDEGTFIYNNAKSPTIKSYIAALKDNGFKDDDRVTDIRENETWLENGDYNVFLYESDFNFFYISISSRQEVSSTYVPQSKPDLSLEVGDFTINYKYANVDVTVTNNTENSSYTFIKAKVIFQNSDGSIITTDETYANSSTPLLPGESRIFSFYTNVGVDTCTCNVSIIDYKKE